MNVAVLGAQTAGQEVASMCALAGHAVSIHDDDATRAMDLIDDIEGRLIDAVETGALTPETKATVMDELDATTDLAGAVSGAEIVIETTSSESELLQERFAEIESAVDRETLITTSSPTVSVTSAAAGVRQPDRALGFHFLDAPGSSVVELVVPAQATAGPVERAERFIESLGATPVQVRDTPGLVSNRVHLALEVEAMRAVEDGIAGVDGIDTVVRDGSEYAEGPLVRADRAGLDSRLTTLERLTEELGPRYEPPAVLRELVEAGKTGAAVGEGFYIWESGEPAEPAIEDPELPERDEQPDDPAHR